MRRLNFVFALLSSVFVVCFTASQDTVNPGLVNVDVKRTIDLTSHLVKASSVVTIENTGKSAENYFIYAIDDALSERLSYIGALVSLLTLICKMGEALCPVTRCLLVVF